VRGLYEIARLTVWEAFRRRTVAVAILLSVCLLVGMALLASRTERRLEHRRAARGQPALVEVNGEPVEHALFTELMRKGGLWILRTFTVFLAILFAAGSIAGERENGALHTMTAKPLFRWQLLMGKWLGLNALLLVYLVVLGAVLSGLLWWRTGTFHAQVFSGALASLLFGVLFTTLTLAFSALFSTWLAAALGLLCWLVGSQEYGLLRVIAHGFNRTSQTRDAADVLFSVCRTCGLLVPTGRIGLWIDHWSGRLDLSGFTGHPGFLAPDPRVWDLAYVAVYVVLVLTLTAWIFSRRDL